MWAVSVVVVPAPDPETTTFEVVSGSRISNRRPPAPVSSPTRMLPQGVSRTGSQELMPPEMMFSATPVAIFTRCTPAWEVPPSLQTIRWVGELLLGYSTIWSALAPRFAAALTTRTASPGATVMALAGSASICAALRFAVEEAFRGATMPKRLSACDFASASTFCPKSTAAAIRGFFIGNLQEGCQDWPCLAFPGDSDQVI